jgi:two-component system sensor histidine kinase KdpD
VLLRTVSHDLRSPISTIRAASAELREGVGTDPAIRAELLGLVVDEAERLDRIVANLLSMSRVEAGALSPDRSPEELHELVAAAVARVRRAGGPRFVVCVSDELPDVDVDRTQIDQVITNLLENAVRHGGGTIHVDAVDRGRRVEVTVTDGGRGFSAEAKAQAFELFHHSGAAGSAGIGLAVCKAIVEAHGGTIRIGDGPAGGARVSFTVEAAG